MLHNLIATSIILTAFEIILRGLVWLYRRENQ